LRAPASYPGKVPSRLSARRPAKRACELRWGSPIRETTVSHACDVRASIWQTFAEIFGFFKVVNTFVPSWQLFRIRSRFETVTHRAWRTKKFNDELRMNLCQAVFWADKLVEHVQGAPGVKTKISGFTIWRKDLQRVRAPGSSDTRTFQRWAQSKVQHRETVGIYMHICKGYIDPEGSTQWLRILKVSHCK